MSRRVDPRTARCPRCKGPLEVDGYRDEDGEVGVCGAWCAGCGWEA